MTTTAGDPRPVVICGFGELGQTVANMIESPLAVSMENRQMPYIAFDLSPDRVRNAREAGFNVMYGNPTHVVSSLPSPSRLLRLLFARQGVPCLIVLARGCLFNIAFHAILTVSLVTSKHGRRTPLGRRGWEQFDPASLLQSIQFILCPFAFPSEAHAWLTSI